MKPTLNEKLLTLAARAEELAATLAAPEMLDDLDRFRGLSVEYARLAPLAARYAEYRHAEHDLAAAYTMLNDPEMKPLAEEEVMRGRVRIETLEHELLRMLLPGDPNDTRNIFLEIRAGTGGDEAALFAGALLRMYLRYAELRGWQTELVSQNSGEHGGYKEVITRVAGPDVYARLKFESGAHRVQRVPETEAQGRIHTSACTVAVLPEIPEVEQVDINPAELKVDTYRASGAGGQHVNKTDSAVRITHLPTGTVVECQDERSQHKNRARAMSLLLAKLLSAEQERQTKEQARNRKLLVGSGDRSERIRTYNFPQGRVTDHRINLTLYKLEQIMLGNMDELIEALKAEHQADLLAALAEEAK